MPHTRILIAAAGALLAAAGTAAPASAAIYKDRSESYKLRIDPSDLQQGAALTIPKNQVGQQGRVYFVYCARKFSKQGELLFGISPITPVRTIRGGTENFSSKRRKCRLEGNEEDKTVAKFKLKRV